MFLTGDKGSTSFAVGTIMVVAVAMLGSLTVLPAVLALLGRPRRQGPRPDAVPAPPAARRPRRLAHLGAPCSTACCAARSSRRSPPVLVLLPSQPGDALARSTTPASTTSRQDLPGDRRARPPRAGVPERRAPRRRGRHPGRRHDRARPSRTAIAELEQPGARKRRRCISRRRRPPDATAHGRARCRCRWPATAPTGLEAGLDDAARRRLIPSHARHGRRRHGRRHRRRPRSTATQSDDAVAQRAAGVRVRADAGVPAAAGHLPVDRDPDQGDRPQPAVGRPPPTACSSAVFQDGHGESLLGLHAAPAASHRGCRCSCS